MITKVYLSVYRESNENFDRVSHGIDEWLRNVPLPNEPVKNFNPKRDYEGLYIMMERD